MNIAMLGCGLMGSKLGILFGRAGHRVTFAYSRSQRKLETLAREAGNGALTATPAEAVVDADVVVLAVHWSRLDDVLALAGGLDNRIVVTCCVPLDDSDAELVVAHTDSGSEQIARRLPNARVAAAFQATPSEVFTSVFASRAQPNRPNCLVCSDDDTAKAVAFQLVEAVGFAPTDAGALRSARYIEPFALLTAVLAYGTDDGPEWVYHFGKLNDVPR